MCPCVAITAGVLTSLAATAIRDRLAISMRRAQYVARMERSDIRDRRSRISLRSMRATGLRAAIARSHMPGSGTDKTKPWTDVAGPIVVLVEPQLGQNIGTVARAMANFGLLRLRLVKPRDGWPNIQAQRAAAGADAVLDGAQLFDTLEAAVADCQLVLATTARQ